MVQQLLVKCPPAAHPPPTMRCSCQAEEIILQNLTLLPVLQGAGMPYPSIKRKKKKSNPMCFT
jgi:hypothetical protein